MKNAITTILVIEDDEVLREAMAAHLEDRDFRVLTAENGRVGLDVFERERPDLVLTDLRMPEVNGLEVLRRAGERSPETPLIVVSGTGRIGDAIEALQLGAWDYILKPVEDMAIITHAVNKALERARLRRENIVYQENLETLVRERTAELQEANRRLAEESDKHKETGENLRITLNSIGDAVMVTDVDGSITGMNPVAEKLTGWLLEEAQGKPQPEVFNIVDPDTRAPAENPVEKVLRSRKAVNLAHHATLIARDATEHQIADSSAPIFSADGCLVGVVLVFHDVTEECRMQKQLRQSERRFRNLFEQSADCCFVHDLEGRFWDVNQHMLDVFGYSMKEMLALSYAQTYADTEEARSVGRAAFERLRAIGSTRFEGQFRKSSGAVFFGEVVSSVIDIDGQKLVQSILRDITDRKRAEAQLLDSRTQLKSLASELVLAEERERRRIAEHLHDNVCQSLAFSKLKLEMMNASLGDPTQMEAVTEVINTLTHMLEEIRTLTFELSSPVLKKFGFEAAVSHWLEEQVERKHGLSTQYANDGQAKPLNDKVEALLFRSVRELLTNVIKHSKANRVGVTTYRDQDEIVTCIEDDGVGFSPDKVVIGSAAGGFGLFSIRERLSQFGGALEVLSAPGQGCKCILRAPLLHSSEKEACPTRLKGGSPPAAIPRPPR